MTCVVLSSASEC